MAKRLEFTNPNWEANSHFSFSLEIASPDTVPRKIGLHALAASDKIYQRLIDAEICAAAAEEISVIDALTGCWNRRYYEKFKEEDFDAVRDHNKIALIFLDINGLKEVNDTMGHDAGDDLIKYAADFLNENFRPGDIVVRLGGDEFLVICRNDQDVGDFEENLNLQERLGCNTNSGFDFENIMFDKEKNYPPDFACGIAIYDSSQDFSLDNTLKRADRLMYRHKIELKPPK